MTLDQLTDRVWQRLLPRALLVGAAPDWPLPVRYVDAAPYEAVVLGLLPPGLLLAMPTDKVCRALLEGLPVLLWDGQPYRRAARGILLKRELEAAQTRLLRLGAIAFGPGVRHTQQEARRLRALTGEDEPCFWAK